MSGTAEWGGIEDAAGLLAVRIAIWNDTGYPEPLPFEGAHPIPPLGQRSADNIKAAHGAVEVIDEIVRDLHKLRSQLISELRTDEDVRGRRVDAMLAEARDRRDAQRKGPVPGPDLSGALDVADDELRDRAAACPDCPRTEGGLCTTCDSRLTRAGEYDALAARIGGAR